MLVEYGKSYRMRILGMFECMIYQKNNLKMYITVLHRKDSRMSGSFRPPYHTGHGLTASMPRLVSGEMKITPKASMTRVQPERVPAHHFVAILAFCVPIRVCSLKVATWKGRL